MKCSRPITTPRGDKVRCRHCMPCRIDYKRSLVGRMILENWGYPGKGSFVTLTYNEQSLPGPNLVREDLTKFIKRCRKSAGQLRYVAVGEYGDKSWRPHFHICFFNVPPNDHWYDFLNKKWNYKDEPIGFIHQGELNQATMDYTAGYCIKKMNRPNDAKLVERGLTQPEFINYSMKPVIGERGLNAIADWLTTRPGSRRLAYEGVPSSFRFKGTLWPIRYSDRIRILSKLDIPEEDYEKNHNIYDETYAAPLEEVQRELVKTLRTKVTHPKMQYVKAKKISALDKREDDLIEEMVNEQAENRAKNYLGKVRRIKKI